MTEEEPTLSEMTDDFKGYVDDGKGPNDTIISALGFDEAVEVSEVGAEDTKEKADEPENSKIETESIITESENIEEVSPSPQDVEDALDVSKTTTELSSELHDEDQTAGLSDRGIQTVGKDEATEVSEVGANNGDDVDISEEDKLMVREMFELFDSDKTGKMSIAELGNFMRAIGMFPTDDEVEDLLTHIDDDGSRMVDYQELLRHMAAQIQIRKSIDPEHDFKEAFLIFDKDGNGRISREELTKILTEHGRMRVSLAEAEEYIAMVDQDNDGMLNYGEFVTLFTEKIGL